MIMGEGEEAGEDEDYACVDGPNVSAPPPAGVPSSSHGAIDRMCSVMSTRPTRVVPRHAVCGADPQNGQNGQFCESSLRQNKPLGSAKHRRTTLNGIVPSAAAISEPL